MLKKIKELSFNDWFYLICFGLTLVFIYYALVTSGWNRRSKGGDLMIAFDDFIYATIAVAVILIVLIYLISWKEGLILKSLY